jgi:hypothetical protein
LGGKKWLRPTFLLSMVTEELEILDSIFLFSLCTA